jgi:hypothetical protein
VKSDFDLCCCCCCLPLSFGGVGGELNEHDTDVRCAWLEFFFGDWFGGFASALFFSLMSVFPLRDRVMSFVTRGN